MSFFTEALLLFGFHCFLVGIAIKTLKKIVVIKQCKNCNGDFEVERSNILRLYKKERSCCSIKCARSFSTKQKRKEISEKVSQTVIKKYDKKGRKDKKPFKCIKCSKPIGRTKHGYCSICFKKSIIHRQLISARVKRDIKAGRHQGWVTRKNITSFAEAFFEKVLDKNGLQGQYVREFKIAKRNLIKESGNWFLDFFFPDKKIDLEIDGKQHEYPDIKLRDQKRDSILTQFGFKIYRIK
jgi:very-short-patch-repair endonuclease